MTKEQLQQFAEALRTGRAKLSMTKAAFCEAADLTPNTLRALEKAAQHPSPDTVEKVARVLGTTAPALTSGKRAIDVSDPLLANLHDEDLEVAQAFHHAPMRVKQRVLGVLQEHAGRPRQPVSADVTTWVKRLLTLDVAQRQAIAQIIHEFEAMKQEQDAPATDNPGPVRVNKRA